MADISKLKINSDTYDIKDASARSDILTKQNILVSGTNIKSINNNSILGSGDLPVVQGEYDTTNTKVELEQGTNALSFIQTTDGLSVTANTGSGSDFIDRELVSKSYVSQYQTEAQVQALILDELSRFDKLDYEIVTTLPATGTAGVRYLVKHATDDRYEEYIYVQGQWYDIGSTDEVNLDNYYTKTEADLLLANKADTADVPTLTSELTNDGDGTHNFVTFGNAATDTSYGVVKLNSSESITLNSSGQLDVGGRLGQFSTSTGVYSPKTIDPANVGNGSFLLTEASGTKLGNKSLAVSTGSGLTLKTSAAAGATQYIVSNTYENRIICAGLVGGTIALNESTASTNYANVVSVQINGSNFVPDSSSTSDSNNNIVITVDKSVNPNSSTTSIRPYCNEGVPNGFSNLFVGQQVGGAGGASVIVGQKVYSASGNACALVGASIYNTGNGSAVFGRQHINRKNRALLAGTGHDTSNAKNESVAALGEWSDLSSTGTLFAIGNGTNAVNRSNIFEVTNNSGQTGLVIKSPNNTAYTLKVDDNGYALVNNNKVAFFNKVTNTSATTATISNMATDTLYVYTQPLTALTITAVEDGPTGIIFKSGSTATNVTLPSTVITPSDYEIKANKTYEFNIMNNLLVMGEW